MRLDQLPVDVVGEQRIDMLIAAGFVRPEEYELFQVADSGDQLDSQQIRQPEDRCALGLGVAMYGVGLDVGLVLDQSIQDIDRFVDAAGG